MRGALARELREGIAAIPAGQYHVWEQEVEGKRRALHLSERGRAIDGLGDRVAGVPEGGRGNRPDIRIILHQEDPSGSGCGSGAPSRTGTGSGSRF